ncbi:GNAT family N-acetyltransferase [Loktanella sp. D2R18]|uniref:GNAT family N-acetyltransferase n=1 Tax=Rhodobacterales TaxID=204455 RepID=UPI000DEB4209|nr:MULTISPECIES: GNAT family N-acetyltransferase [Rhodobacterales]MDO6588785.1 GNAT family N-acetyltransferase [Yoonia sp. 1_MG-2023]RBW41984.1 GNAT family N-acetyltransferase [Loktanella sp. D2R18]
MIPTLYTDRLVLRPFARDDFDAYAAFMGSDRAVHMDGPINKDKAWDWFTNDIATWALYGFGSLAITENGKFAGGAGLVHPPHFPEPECGWFLFDGFTGRGIAQEAARAMIDYTFATTLLQSIVSYIGRENAESIRVAESLGAVRDPNAATPKGDNCLVYRHTKGASNV